MIYATDATIVDNFNSIWGIPVERMIYGQLNVAKRYWIQNVNNLDKGVATFPFLAFFHTVSFHPEFRKVNSVDVIKNDGNPYTVKSMPIFLNYTVEIIGENVVDQNDYIKNYMIWCGEKEYVDIIDDGIDATDNTFQARMIPEDPEDNSDLENETEEGRIVRTTFNFSVETLLWLDGVTKGIIYKILAGVHLYNGNEAESQKIFDVLVE